VEKILPKNTRRSLSPLKLSRERHTVNISLWQYADWHLIVDRVECIPVSFVLRYFSQISVEGIVTMLFVVSHSPSGFAPCNGT
jgi:hypothetical protein